MRNSQKELGCWLMNFLLESLPTFFGGGGGIYTDPNPIHLNDQLQLSICIYYYKCTKFFSQLCQGKLKNPFFFKLANIWTFYEKGSK